jgi:hypothetical protein
MLADDHPDLHAYFRFLTPPPFKVFLGGATYEVQLESVTFSANMHHVIGDEIGKARYAKIGVTYLDRQWLEDAAFRVGLKVRRGTTGEKIMRRLVFEGRAELVTDTAAADALQYKPPQKTC